MKTQTEQIERVLKKLGAALTTVVKGSTVWTLPRTESFVTKDMSQKADQYLLIGEITEALREEGIVAGFYRFFLKHTRLRIIFDDESESSKCFEGSDLLSCFLQAADELLEERV